MRMNTNRLMTLSWLTGTLVLAGCADGNRENANMGSGMGDSTAMMGQNGNLGNDSSAMGRANNGQLDDSQIANVAMTANRLDSTAAAAVVGRLRNAEVKAYARMMIKDHGSMMDSIRVVTAALGTNPTVNQVSSGNQTTSGNQGASYDQITASLERMAAPPMTGTGAELDRAYMNNEVQMHQQVLRTIDETLLPQSRDASLKRLVERMRTSVTAHLQKAEAIQATISSN